MALVQNIDLSTVKSAIMSQKVEKGKHYTPK
jgi:hypothetical protein